MAETEQHFRDGAQVVDGIPEDDSIDWKTIDRLIILLSLTVTEKILRRRSVMEPEIKDLILKRMRMLIDVYKKPSRRGRR